LAQEFYSQHFIFVTREMAQQAGVFVPCKPFQPWITKHTSLCCPFEGYGKN
jgi:hypothetical protein